MQRRRRIPLELSSPFLEPGQLDMVRTRETQLMLIGLIELGFSPGLMLLDLGDPSFSCCSESFLLGATRHPRTSLPSRIGDRVLIGLDLESDLI